ncbi:FtsX-like permease family [Corynebacterium mustelae]|uniref:FtsX-like permease family n=1 Tax=Corynebacterium mustelae TaxID=571915 RepID=A0A0G3H5X0_9CORY|nr:ABC transporter permease [Corynebacterium mustelae]AKK07228.1 FtsX-like permease family [Corynebacterium mustelae]
MWRQILIGDFRRSIPLSITLTLLIAVAATLVISGTAMTSQTFGAVSAMWNKAQPPDLMQMHAGPLDEQGIYDWAQSQSGIDDVQIIRTLPIPPDGLWLAGTSQSDSVLEPALVTPSEKFDFLLTETGQRVQPEPGEVILPVHYSAVGTADLGDEMLVAIAGEEKRLRVAGFARDMQMNPSMVTSKRLVVHPEDFEYFANKGLESEYLIEFMVADDASISTIQDAYTQAQLPAQGVAIDAAVLKLMNALTTLITAVLALCIALLLVCIAVLALRFAFITSIVNDIQHIGTLKAIGAPGRAIKRMYIMKYLVLSVIGTLIGAVAAVGLTRLAMKPVLLYLGKPSQSFTTVAPPIVAAFVVPLIVAAFCWLLLRRLDHVSPTEVLAGSGTERRTWRRQFRLGNSRMLPANIWLGLTAATEKSHALLVAVIAVATFLLVFPVSLLATFNNANFSTYLGIGKSDIRIDVRAGSGVDFSELSAEIQTDEDIAESVSLVTNRLQVLGSEGWENIVVERGDHSVFPLNYTSGVAPTTETEIAVSVNQAQELEAVVGQEIQITDGTDKRNVRVSGIYQDITNGGRTAKATFATDAPTLWQVMYVTVKPGVDIAAKTQALSEEFPFATITDVADYTRQTLGATTGQISIIVALSAGAALGLVFLMTVLFLILVFAQERGQISTLYMIGASRRTIIGQYLARFFTVGIIGIGIGVIVAAFGGTALLSSALGLVGAPGVQLLPNPVISYILLPALVLGVMVVATLIAAKKITPA